MEEFVLTQTTSTVTPNLFIDHRVFYWGEDNKQLVYTKACAKQGIHIHQERVFNQQHAAFNFCFQGNQQFRLTGNYTPVSTDHSHHHMLILPSETFTLDTESQFEIFSLTLSLPMFSFAQIMQEYLPKFPANYLNCMEHLDRCYFKKYPWSPRLTSSIKNLILPTTIPLASSLYLESKMLEILALIFDHMISTDPTTTRNIKIKKRHQEKIYEVKEILEKNLANPPGLHQLAKQVGTNVFTLKNEFKAIFGMPVFQWVIKQKMEHAANLLLNTSLSIQEIASTIGYENNSAFTRAFKQHFNTLPSMYKK